jgi:hypothetical protein
MSSFESLAEYGASFLPGINWAAVPGTPGPEGRVGVWANRTQTNYFNDAMLPAWDAAVAVRDTLELSNAADTAALMAGFTSAAKPLREKAPEFLAAAATGGPQAMVAAEDAAEIGTEYLRAAVTALYFTALDGMIVHRYVMLQKLAAKHITITDADIQAHADHVTRSLQAIKKLDDWGLLRPIKKPGISGLGWAVPTIGLGAAIVIVGIAAVLAAAMVYVVYISKTNERAIKFCEEARAAGDAELWQGCVKAALDDAHGAGQLPYKISSDVLMYLAIGGAVLLGITFLPEIVTSMKHARRAARA